LSASGISVDARLNKKQRKLQTICSCAPRAFTFTLLLAQDCSVNTLDANPGISDTNCVIVNDSSLSFSGDDQMIAVADTGVPIEEITDCIPWLDNCKFESTLVEPIRNRELQTGSPIPSFITSIQFIELNSVGAVLQIDDSQKDLEAVSGDTFSFLSTASQLDPTEDLDTQIDIVPKTVVLFMVGVNDNGDQIRGRFVWQYTNGCGDDDFTITGGEDYGWVSFDSVGRALPEFCPALHVDTLSPTPAPFIIENFPTPPPMINTPFPTPSPTMIETPIPSMSPVVSTDPPTSLLFPTFSPTTTPTFDLFPTTEVPLTPSPTKGTGQLPTTQRPFTMEPTYFITDKPTSSYGYGDGQHYTFSNYGTEESKNSTKRSKNGKRFRSGKGSSSKSGKGSSSKSGKGSSSKSGKGSKDTRMNAKNVKTTYDQNKSH